VYSVNWSAVLNLAGNIATKFKTKENEKNYFLKKRASPLSLFFDDEICEKSKRVIFTF